MTFSKRSKVLLPLLILAVLLPAAFSLPLANIAAAPAAPVWGRKPVLAYFATTAGLEAELRQATGLSAAGWALLAETARQESEALRALENSSLAVLGDPQRPFEQKQAWVAASGYNQQVAGVLERSDEALQAGLDAEQYQRLVRWIEQRWQAERLSHGLQAFSLAAGGPRSYRIYATRYDSGGTYTVALPDKCLKLANGGASKCSGYEYGQNYAVRLQYNGGPAVKVTVGEAGPWNVDDNFWATTADPQPRRLFTDLPLGMPAAQAAYFDDYNGGLDQFGRQVTSPVAIDLARQVSIDIGLQPGKNDWIDAAFLWTENWPGGSVVEVTVKEPTRLKPAYSGDMCGSAWHKLTGFGGSPAYLTLNVQTAGQSTNSAEWVPDLPAAGEYKVEAFVPDHPPIEWQCPAKSIPRDTAKARYTIIYAGGSKTVEGNQGPLANGWLNLGTYSFNAGAGGKVTLSDLTGEESYSRTVAFSAVRFVKSAPATPQPSPTPAPTPTPTPLPPDPTLWAGSGSPAPGESLLVPVQVLSLRGLRLGSATVEVRFNPHMLTPLECQPDPAGLFDAESCDLNADRDGSDPDAVRINVSSAAGTELDPRLALVRFQVQGEPGTAAQVVLIPLAFNDPAGSPLPYRTSPGLVCLAPCRNLAYFPVLPRLFEWLP